MKYQLMPEQTQTMIKLMKSTSLVLRLTKTGVEAACQFMNSFQYGSWLMVDD